MKSRFYSIKRKVVSFILFLSVSHVALFASDVDFDKLCKKIDSLLVEKNYKEAMMLGKKELSRYDKNSVNYAQILYRIAKTYEGTLEYSQAEKLFKKSMDIAEKYDIESIGLQCDIAYATMDFYLATNPFYMTVIDYLLEVVMEKADKLTTLLSEQIEHTLNDSISMDTSKAGNLFSRMDYEIWRMDFCNAKYFSKFPYLVTSDEVLEVCGKFRTQTSEMFGENSKEYAHVNLLCGEHQEAKSQFEEAFMYYKQSFELYHKLYGPQSLDYAKLNYFLGKIESYLGDSRTAMERFQETIKIHEQHAMCDGIYVSTLEAIGAVYTTEGKYEEAIACFKRAEEYGTRLFGEKSFQSFRCKVKMAEIMIATESYDKAQTIIDELDKHQDEMSDEDSMEVFYLQALLLMKTNKYAHARVVLQALLEIVEKGYQSQNQENAIRLYNDLGYCSYRTGQYDESHTYYKNYIDLAKRYARNVFIFMPEAKREHYWKIQSEYLENLLCINHTTTTYDPERDTPMIPTSAFNERSSLLYDAALLQKGTLLEASKNLFSAIESSGDKTLQQKLERLQEVQQHLANVILQRRIGDTSSNIEELQLESEKLEQELIAQSRKYSEYMAYLNIGWKNVQKSLGEHDVAIEFVCSSDKGRKYYSAEILRKDFSTPKHVSLFSVAENSPLAFDLKKVDRFLWPKIIPYLNEQDNVYFSASGDLHKYSIEYFLTNTHERMYDKYQMRRVSSTRQLAINTSDSNKKTVTLYGGMDYNLGIEEMAYYSEISRQRGEAERKNLNEMGTVRLWGYLPGTESEVLNISPILHQEGYHTTTYLGAESIEENFKKQSGNSSGIVHIATHGFYLPPKSSGRIMFSDFQTTAEDESLLYSGLIFSGANHAWLGNGALGKNVDDGILTAKEIASLNLQSTDLVVLSACQTGQGEITGEGVFGLQRAFKKAGVNTILMSLWEVNDEATQQMMTSFYDHYTKGMNKHEALKKAQEEIKLKTFINDKGEEESGDDPHFWAAFILLD